MAEHPPSRPALLNASTMLGFLLASVGQAIQSGFREELARYGNHPRAFGLLLALDEGGGQSQQQLSQRLGVPPSRVVALVDDLVESGLVERTVAPKDRRVHTIELTPQGRQHLSRLAEAAHALESRVTAGLSDDDQSTLQDLLDRVATNLGDPAAGGLRLW